MFQQRASTVMLPIVVSLCVLTQNSFGVVMPNDARGRPPPHKSVMRLHRASLPNARSLVEKNGSVVPLMDQTGRPNCRGQTMCFDDEVNKIAYPTQLIEDAVANLRQSDNRINLTGLSERDTNRIPLAPLLQRPTHYGIRAAEQDLDVFSYRGLTTEIAKSEATETQDRAEATSATRSYNDAHYTGHERPVCEATSFRFPLKAALTESGHWRYIVNSDHYTQVVTGSICTNEGDSCDVFRFLLTIRSACRQRYMKYSFTALDPESQELIEEKFLIPSACVCTFKRFADE